MTESSVITKNFICSEHRYQIQGQDEININTVHIPKIDNQKNLRECFLSILLFSSQILLFWNNERSFLIFNTEKLVILYFFRPRLHMKFKQF